MSNQAKKQFTLGASVLELESCPHCRVTHPLLQLLHGPTPTKAYDGSQPRNWCIYVCKTCGGVLLAESATYASGVVGRLYPPPDMSIQDSEVLPQRARDYLQQALRSSHAPAGAVLLAASAVDAMLKDRGYKTGSLKSRIDQAAAQNLITKTMAEWAHEVRLDANEQRHADEEVELPSKDDASRTLQFALALAEYLFILPARIDSARKKPAIASN